MGLKGQRWLRSYRKSLVASGKTAV